MAGSMGWEQGLRLHAGAAWLGLQSGWGWACGWGLVVAGAEARVRLGLGLQLGGSRGWEH